MIHIQYIICETCEGFVPVSEYDVDRRMRDTCQQYYHRDQQCPILYVDTEIVTISGRVGSNPEKVFLSDEVIRSESDPYVAELRLIVGTYIYDDHELVETIRGHTLRFCEEDADDILTHVKQGDGLMIIHGTFDYIYHEKNDYHDEDGNVFIQRQLSISVKPQAYMHEPWKGQEQYQWKT